jgi:hypothetical protein
VPRQQILPQQAFAERSDARPAHHHVLNNSPFPFAEQIDLHSAFLIEEEKHFCHSLSKKKTFFF